MLDGCGEKRWRMSDYDHFNICPECGSTDIGRDKYKALFKVDEWKCFSCRHVWEHIKLTK
jgi:hypothetical protein